MRTLEKGSALAIVLFALAMPSPVRAAEELPSTAARPDHAASADRHRDEPEDWPETPPLPDGMSLDDVLDRAARPPPDHYPDPVPDDDLHGFVLVEQLEYRVRSGDGDQLGWEAQGWVGWDYDRLWVKSEGEAVFEGPDEGESETDVLYSRRITPFWSAQIGFQYANGWESGQYDDRWSGALALQGLAPGHVEVDLSMYVSDAADVTFELEAEYNLRITQRLVLQPRAELGFSAQDVPSRDLGSGMTDASLDLRLRYELEREIAPYVGARFRFLVGETADIAAAAGRDASPIFFVAGARLAF
jgi:copper resistance protein B